MDHGRKRYNANAYCSRGCLVSNWSHYSRPRGQIQRHQHAATLAKHKNCNCDCASQLHLRPGTIVLECAEDSSGNTDLLRHIMSAGELGGWTGAGVAARPLDLDIEVEVAPLFALVAVEP